jgi:hypothetical protein
VTCTSPTPSTGISKTSALFLVCETKSIVTTLTPAPSLLSLMTLPSPMVCLHQMAEYTQLILFRYWLRSRWQEGLCHRHWYRSRFLRPQPLFTRLRLLFRREPGRYTPEPQDLCLRRIFHPRWYVSQPCYNVIC